VLGNNESCTGDAARRSGNEYLFSELAQMNIETLNAAGVDQKKIVTGCPHCLNTLSNEYPALGGNYTVLHHTQLMAELIGTGQLKLNHSRQGDVTFHDPCYLGRYNQEYDAPRRALAEAGLTLLEMDRHKINSFCCGGGGGALAMPEFSERRIAAGKIKADEIRATGANVVLQSCHNCTDQLKDICHHYKIDAKVMNLAELVDPALIL
jgi:Fe-S oxidoreductase